MELRTFDFDKNIRDKEMLDHIRYYYTMSNIAMMTAEKNKYEAMEIYKEIRKNLGVEYKEYHKVKNFEFIRRNKLYSQYVDNLTNAFVKPTNVTSYKMLNSNLYDVQDYICYGFSNYFDFNHNSDFDLNKIDSYLGKYCKLKTKDYLIFEGYIDQKTFNHHNNTLITIFDFEKWNQIDSNNIMSIQILDK